MKHLTKDEQRRVRCSVNESEEFPCALMPLRGERFVLLNQSFRKKHRIREGQSVHVELTKDDSEYGMPYPEGLSAVLEQDEEAGDFFNRLSMGKGRSLIYLILTVKNPNIRINKSLAIAHHLSTQHGIIDYKQLQVDLREFAKQLIMNPCSLQLLVN